MSSDEEAQVNHKPIRRRVRIQQKQQLNSNEFCVYTSLKNKSTHFKVETAEVMSPLEVKYAADFAPIKNLKEELGTGIAEEDHVRIEAIKKRARLMAQMAFEQVEPDEAELDRSFTEGNARLTCQDHTLQQIQQPQMSRYKLFFKFKEETKSLVVTGHEQLQELLVQTKFDFTSQPRVYKPTEETQSTVELLPLPYHQKPVEQIGFSPFSIVDIVCFADEVTSTLPEMFGKVVLTFKIGEKHKFAFYSQPDDPIWKVIERFESSQSNQFNLDSAKYYFDGDFVNVNLSPVDLEMESGDIIDVYLSDS